MAVDGVEVFMFIDGIFIWFFFGEILVYDGLGRWAVVSFYFRGGGVS